jgi:hemerythrin
MSTLSWTPELVTGIAAIDADHREIIALTNKLAMDPTGHDSIGGSLALLKFMEVHVTKHFFSEEEQMARTRYPQMLEHMVEHGRLIEYITSLAREVKADNVDADTLSISNRLLCNWMVSHIAIHDRQLAAFLRDAAPVIAVGPAHEPELKVVR